MCLQDLVIGRNTQFAQAAQVMTGPGVKVLNARKGRIGVKVSIQYTDGETTIYTRTPGGDFTVLHKFFAGSTTVVTTEISVYLASKDYGIALEGELYASSGSAVFCYMTEFYPTPELEEMIQREYQRTIAG